MNPTPAAQIGRPREQPSPAVAAGASFVMFAIGAVIPLLPHLMGFESLWLGLTLGGVGLTQGDAVS